MEMIFVDAENVGLKVVQSINSSLIDKVFVFSKSELIRDECNRGLYLYLNDYPNNSNQADFYIIAYLSRSLTLLSNDIKNSISFKLITNDESLIDAFSFQCELFEVKHSIERTKTDFAVPIKQVSKSTTTSIEDKIYNHLGNPQFLNEKFWGGLCISQSDFTKALTILIDSKKIKRCPNDKKKWVRSK